MVLSDNAKTIRVTGYSPYDLLSSVMGAADPDSVQTNTTEYGDLLKSIREKISENHANTLNGILTNPNAHNILMPIILSYVTDYVNTSNDLTININRYAERIYQDMAGFGILTPYLNDPSVEEININTWNSIEIIWSNRKVLLEDTFSSAQECVDIIRKMVRLGGVHIDFSQPIIDSFIGNGTRISATLPPINLDESGATASIRKQTHKNVTREKYLDMGFATEKVFDFIRMGTQHNISIGFAGSPGAGKTTFMTCLLKDFLRNSITGNNRIITIEEAREIDLVETEAHNPSGGTARMISPVLQWNTKLNGEHPVTARHLIKHTLRYNPRIVVPAEMRGDEAIEAIEAGLTGVQIMSSFHAWGAQDGYSRVLSMCQMGKTTASETTLLNQIIKAFPLMVFIKKDDDGVRRIHEVFEATGVEEGRVTGNTLFKFVRTKVTEDENGRIVNIEGKFLQFDSISKSLRRKLIQEGAKKQMVDEYYFEGESPDHPELYQDADVELVTVQSDPFHEEFVEEELPTVEEKPTPEAENEAPKPTEGDKSSPVAEEIEKTETEIKPLQKQEPRNSFTSKGLSFEDEDGDDISEEQDPESTEKEQQEENESDGHPFKTETSGEFTEKYSSAVKDDEEAVEIDDVLESAPEQKPSTVPEAPQWNVARRFDDTPKKKGFWSSIRDTRGEGGDV